MVLSTEERLIVILFVGIYLLLVFYVSVLSIQNAEISYRKTKDSNLGRFGNN